MWINSHKHVNTKDS